jgi:xylan 1,4-beta-xylosidase
VLNALRMLAMLKGDRLVAQSSAALPIDTILADGVVAAPDLDVAATRDSEVVNILVWNYHDDDVPDAKAADVSLEVAGLGDAPVVSRHFRMDRDHSNAHTLFLADGAPQPPSAEQYARLKAADGLEMLEEAQTLQPDGGAVKLGFSLPRSAVSLISLVPG